MCVCGLVTGHLNVHSLAVQTPTGWTELLSRAMREPRSAAHLGFHLVLEGRWKLGSGLAVHARDCLCGSVGRGTGA